MNNRTSPVVSTLLTVMVPAPLLVNVCPLRLRALLKVSVAPLAMLAVVLERIPNGTWNSCEPAATLTDAAVPTVEAFTLTLGRPEIV